MAQFLESSICREVHRQPDWEPRSSSRTRAFRFHKLRLSKEYSISSGFESTNTGHAVQFSMLCSPQSATRVETSSATALAPARCTNWGASGAQEDLRNPQTTKPSEVPNGGILLTGRQSSGHRIPDSSRISSILNLRKDKRL